MNKSKNQRRGVVVGVSVLAGAAAVALSVVGITQYEDVTVQQQDVALTAGEAIGTGAIDPGAYNPADFAHANFLDAQVLQNSSLFDSDNAWQQSIYYNATDPSSLFPGNTDSPADEANSLFNGAFSRFTEANLVSQAMQQVQLDHMLGVNQTFGVGGYESEIGNALHGDLIGAGITPGTPLAADLAALIDPDTQASFSGFSDALSGLHDTLMQSAFTDLFSMFSIAP